MQELTQEEVKIYWGFSVLLEVKVRIFSGSIKANVKSRLRDKRNVRIARHGSFPRLLSWEPLGIKGIKIGYA